MASPYDIQRARLKSDAAQTNQEQNTALTRRFARMGALNSGAAIKASERLAGQQEQNLQRANEGIDVQESQAQEQKDEIARGRAFATSERLGSQSYASGESALGRRFAREERLGGQEYGAAEALKGRDWQSGESALARRFATTEREASQGFSRGERELGQQFAADQAHFGRLYQTQEREHGQQFAEKESAATRKQQSTQWDAQFAEDKRVTDFNMKMAEKMANKNEWYEGFGDLKGGTLGKVGGNVFEWGTGLGAIKATWKGMGG